jgi:CHAT domain-containing protein/tetratricopeptide (TPR) repeat protein
MSWRTDPLHWARFDRARVRARATAAIALAGLCAVTALGQNLSIPDRIRLHEQKLADDKSAGNQTADETDQLDALCSLYEQMSSAKQALDDCNQALQLAQGAGNRGSEALTLEFIGRTYAGIGQNQKALETYNQALPILRELNNRSDEAVTLGNIGSIYSALGQNQNALDNFNEALPILRELGKRTDEASTTSNIALVYSHLGQNQKALETYNQALSIFREVGDRMGEAVTLSNLAAVYSALGRKQDALENYKQALAILRDLGNRKGEAATLNNMGVVYADLGQNQEALDYYNQALPIRREVGDRNGESTTLDNIGGIYSSLGQNQQALDSYNQALPIRREVGDRYGEAATLNNIGEAYTGLGQDQKALEFYNQALPIRREVSDPSGEAVTLDNIGWVYAELGEKRQALDYYAQALPIERAAGDRKGEAVTLNNIGVVHSDLGQNKDALRDYERALPIERAVGDRADEADSLNNIAWVYFDTGHKRKGLSYFSEALPIEREVGDRSGEATTLDSIAAVYFDQGDGREGLPNAIAALYLARAVGDPELQGSVDGLLMKYFRSQHHSDAAILFGMDAVNSYQEIRRNISGLDKTLQTGFAQSKSATYRQLAELLVQADRLGEAERVLDLLKEQELKEVVRGGGDDATAKVEPLALTPAQQTAQSALAAPEKTAESLTDASVEYSMLLAKKDPTDQDKARLKSLDASIEQGDAEVSDFFKTTLYPALAAKAGAANANDLVREDKSDLSRLQNVLADLGPRVMGIRLLLTDDHAYAIVVTAHTREKFELKGTSAELRNKVLQVRDELRDHTSDPKPHLAELYGMVISPFESELKALEQTSAPDASGTPPPTLLWSLDGVLRYLPMTALYDGQHYMLERFNNVLFTPESYGHMTSPSQESSGALRVLAMGLSKSFGGLAPLPGVLPELDAVVHDPSVPESHGPMDGVLLPNEQFTFAALEEQLGAGTTFPVVHIASHFVLEYGSGDEPYLMMGGETTGQPQGYQLTLSKLEDSPISFHGTRLLTLSACSTAKGDVGNDGMEMDSLGMVAQQKDAEAVLATLWDVNDASTSKIMSDFYARWVKNPAEGKAEALRQAQLGLLRSASSPGGTDYSHPFYWAPFVLIGNFQ